MNILGYCPPALPHCCPTPPNFPFSQSPGVLRVVGWFCFEADLGFKADQLLHPPKFVLGSLSFIFPLSLWQKKNESISNAFLFESKKSGSLTSSKCPFKEEKE